MNTPGRKWSTGWIAAVLILPNAICQSMAFAQGTQQSPGQQSPGQQSPGQQSPGQQSPGQQSPGQQSPGQQSPGQQGPGQQGPGQQGPGQQGPGQQTGGQKSEAVVTVTLKSITVLKDNESGPDEFRFDISVNGSLHRFPGANAGTFFSIPAKATFPFTIPPSELPSTQVFIGRMPRDTATVTISVDAQELDEPQAPDRAVATSILVLPTAPGTNTALAQVLVAESLCDDVQVALTFEISIKEP